MRNERIDPEHRPLPSPDRVSTGLPMPYGIDIAPDASTATEYVTDWGLGTHNRRFVTSENASINRANVATLQLAWGLAFPRVTDMRSQPAIIGDTLHFGDKTGKVYALDRTTGCVRAHTKVFSGIRSAITVATLTDAKKLLVFADSVATVFAMDPASLEIVWQTSARLFDTSVISGSISYDNNRLLVPVSSYEVAVSGSPSHICCTSHGGVIALDASNGENLTHPATDTSDAIIALDMDSGALAWRFRDFWRCMECGLPERRRHRRQRAGVGERLAVCAIRLFHVRATAG